MRYLRTVFEVVATMKFDAFVAAFSSGIIACTAYYTAQRTETPTERSTQHAVTFTVTTVFEGYLVTAAASQQSPQWGAHHGLLYPSFWSMCLLQTE